MIIKQWIEPDFIVSYKEDNFVASISLKEGVITMNAFDKDGNQKDIENREALRVVNRGLEVWNDKKQMWVPCNDKIMKAYSDYIAEQALLGGNDGTTNDGNDTEALSS